MSFPVTGCLRARRRMGYAALAPLTATLGGCGNNASTDSPNRLVDADGQIIVLEDIAEIANDASIGDEQKRQQFRQLGLQDEKLIEAPLTL